jgi:hypothetical protein
MADYIELNMSNYSEDDVSQLNEWGIEAVARIEKLKKSLQHIMRHQDAMTGGLSRMSSTRRIAADALEADNMES